MFRILVLIGTILIVLGIPFHYIFTRSKSHLSSETKHKLLKGFIRKAIYALMLLCFLILGITGFYPPLRWNLHLSGYFLMTHVTIAPIFASLLVLLTLMWAHLHSFKRGETNKLSFKISFWLMIVFVIPLMVSIIFSLYPLFGGRGQELLVEIHRYCAVFFTIAALIHTYLILSPSHR